MAFGRPIRRWLTSWLVLAVLFTQFATAVYSCPLGSVSPDQVPSPQAAIPCAAMMDMGTVSLDPAQPGLCIEHCKPSAQTIDPLHAPTATTPAVISMVELILPHDEPHAGGPSLNARSQSAERPPPPLSILHCCYRI